MAFDVPPLPYDYGALEPTIDEETMRLHHDKHHQAYVDNANAALAAPSGPIGLVEQVLVEIDLLPEEKRTAVRNNAGGHANHSLFWEIMSPDGGGEPSGSLGKAIDDTFGGLDELKQLVNDGGVKRFGSGWSWLVWDGTGLAVYSTPNQDSPILKDWDDVPLLGIDVWEHAYYLNYQNRRPEYLARLVERRQLGRRPAALRRSEVDGTDRSEGLSLGPVRKDSISSESSETSPTRSTGPPARPAGRHARSDPA
jgi:Fe-Mn family superoxide dismutase